MKVGFLKAVFVCLLVLMQAAYSESVKIDAPEVFHVKGEQLHLTTIPGNSWSGGTTLTQLYSLRPRKSTATPGALQPGSVVVRKDNRALTPGKDYAVDYKWASLWIPKGSSITPQDALSVDYAYTVRRIDSKIIDVEGKTVIRKGKGSLTTPEIPAIKPDEKRVCNYFIDYDGLITKYPIRLGIPDIRQTTGPAALPGVMGKLKRGEAVKIVCWGDSVTSGGDASCSEKSYPHVFEKMLREKFPESSIKVDVISVGGSKSLNWLHPDKFPYPQRAKDCNFQRIVDARPDLVTIEFVNDSFMTEAQVRETYSEILSRLRGLGAEVVLITPHFVSEYAFSSRKDVPHEENRPYVKGLKSFAKEHGVALADVSACWQQLADEGIPYVVYLQNGINHPDDRGHRLFAEELMRCFTPHNSVTGAATGKDGK